MLELRRLRRLSLSTLVMDSNLAMSSVFPTMDITLGLK